MRTSAFLIVVLAAGLLWSCGGSEGSGDAATGVDLQQDKEVVADVDVCEPSCTGKQCGDDGCGGQCGTCFTPEGAQDSSLCRDNGTCCVPQCLGKTCGDNGCGGVCGECNEGVECLGGQCADSCVPNCTGKECGNDGCNGSCGNCIDKSGAVNNDLCVDGACCVPDCKFKQCGDDGCGGTCGACDNGLTCDEGVCKAICVPDCDGKECGYDGCTGSCGYCPDGDVCEDHQCVNCLPDCSGKECGSNGCGGTCGTCEAGTKCETGTCVCVPQCQNLACGDDSCGGSCGECDDGNPCTSDACEAGECVFTLMALEDLNVLECACATDDDCEALEDGDICNGTLYCNLDGDVGLCDVDAETILECDDNLPCTDDVCDPDEGCQSVPNDDLECADGDACNGMEYCESGQCKDGPDPVCDDENPCTDDSCDAADGCVYVNNDENGCGDDDVCNGVEVCNDGECVTAPGLECDDENPCTDDTCDPVNGCVFTNNDANACQDADVCNGMETCSAGACIAGETLVCDDNDACNGTETCDASEGCLPGQALVCDDNDACNGTETCDATEGCLPGQALVCDDEDECTTDSCDAAEGCKNEAIPGCGEGPPTWSADIEPIVKVSCFGCHTNGSSNGGLNMDTLAFKDEASAACADITKGVAISLKIRPDWTDFCSGSRMPKTMAYLSADQQKLFADWVAGGMLP